MTIKSDDVPGRVKVYEAIVKGENIPDSGIPESFKVLVKEMQSLCLNVEVLSQDGSAIALKDAEEDVFRAAEELASTCRGASRAASKKSEVESRAASRRRPGPSVPQP